jgi:archaellum component FlaF (FlaF/FlaG flagellin family)
MKFLIIILSVFGLIFIAILVFLKFLRNTITNLFSQSQNRTKKQADDVLFNKDEVVVLKGEAKDKKNKWKAKGKDV